MWYWTGGLARHVLRETVWKRQMATAISFFVPSICRIIKEKLFFLAGKCYVPHQIHDPRNARPFWVNNVNYRLIITVRDNAFVGKRSSPPPPPPPSYNWQATTMQKVLAKQCLCLADLVADGLVSNPETISAQISLQIQCKVPKKRSLSRRLKNFMTLRLCKLCLWSSLATV